MNAYDLRALNAFIHAAKLGSFTAAAQRLDLTPAAVSKSVAGLEQSLGVRLFQRTTRSLHLTAEGDRFFAQAQAALDLLEQAADSVRGGSGGAAGLVRISVSNVIGRHLLMPHTAELLERYPDLRLEIDFEDRIIDFVQAGYDLVLRGGMPADSSLVSRTVAPLHICLAASPDYLARHGTPHRPDDLAAHRLIMRHFLGGKLMPWYFREGDALRPFEPPRRALTLTDPEAVTRAALDGSGIAEVPLYLAWEHLQNGTLKTLLADTHHSGSYQLTLQYAHRNLPPRVRTVADHLLAALRRHPALQEQAV